MAPFYLHHFLETRCICKYYVEVNVLYGLQEIPGGHSNVKGGIRLVQKFT